MALDDYPDKSGELSRKHGNTLSVLAAGCSESDRMMNGLDQLDDASLNKVAHDREAGKLARILLID
jgi:hypothetical protein